MKKELKQTTKINVKKGDLWQLKDEIYYYSLTNNLVLQELFDKIKDDESDINMMITVLLFTAPNSIFKDNENNYCNSFTKFLKTLISDSFFDEEIKWFLTESHHLVFIKGEFLFILNSNDYDIASQLPDYFMNCTLHCENCNEEIDVTTFINVPANTFYIITKE